MSAATTTATLTADQCAARVLRVPQGVVIPAVVWKVADSARRLAIGNRRLAAAGAALTRRAVLDERVRIARELHDVVAHHGSHLNRLMAKLELSSRAQVVAVAYETGLVVPGLGVRRAPGR